MPKIADQTIIDAMITADAAGISTVKAYQKSSRVNGWPSTKTIADRFGSWNQLRSKLGLELHDGRPLGTAYGNDTGYHGQTGGGYLNNDGRIVAPRKPICCAHLWTVEDADGNVIYREHTYPTLDFLKKKKVLPVRGTGCAIVRVDYLCPA